MEQRQQEIIANFKQITQNTREALRLTDMPESLVLFYTMNLPDLEKLSLEELVRFYSEIKVAIVLYLFDMGLTRREIAKRLGGHTYNMVFTILDEHRPSKKNDNDSRVPTT